MIINNIEEMSIEDINEAISLLEKEKIKKRREEYINVLGKIRDVISKVPSDYKSRSIVIGDEIFDWYDLEEAIIGLIKDARYIRRTLVRFPGRPQSCTKTLQHFCINCIIDK